MGESYSAFLYLIASICFILALKGLSSPTTARHGNYFGIAGMDWQQRINWDRLREYRIERARQMMKKHGLGALLCMYDENCRYITGTLTPGWNRLKPGLR